MLIIEKLWRIANPNLALNQTKWGPIEPDCDETQKAIK